MAKPERTKPVWARLLLIVVVLAVGGGGATLLWVLRKEPQREDRSEPAPLVEVVPARPHAKQVVVEAFATVRARDEVAVVPQVSGQVVWVSPALSRGSFFAAGQTLMRIDPTDYEQELARVTAEWLQARVAIQTRQEEVIEVEAKKDDAESELKNTRKLAEVGGAEPRELERAELALKQANARLAMAELAVTQARANEALVQTRVASAAQQLARTFISMPFAGRVLEESVTAGRFVVSGQSIGTVYATDVVEIPVPLEDEELQWIRVPGGMSGEADGGTLRDAQFQAAQALGNLARILREASATEADAVDQQALKQALDVLLKRIAGRTPREGEEKGAGPDQPKTFTGAPVTDPHKVDRSGSAVTVRYTFRGKSVTREGWVTRTEGQIDPQSRMVHVVVEVPGPFASEDGKAPLEPGQFVEVAIRGEAMGEGVLRVPRRAVDAENRVWVVHEGKLSLREDVRVVRSDDAYAYVASGLSEGDQVVISPMAAPFESMPVRTQPGAESEQNGDGRTARSEQP